MKLCALLLLHLLVILCLGFLAIAQGQDTTSNDSTDTADEIVETSTARDEIATGSAEDPARGADASNEPTVTETTVPDPSPLVIDDVVPVAGMLAPTVVDSTMASVPRVADTPVVIGQTTELGTRTIERLSDIPVTVGIIGESEILRIAPLSFDNLTWTEPNVETLGGGRYLGEQITIRGEGGNAVTVRIDGGRQNFVSGHSGQRFFVEPDFMSQVEILRGAGSFLYGSGSAGVINISTLDPQEVINEGGDYGLRIRNQFHDNSNEWAHSIVGAAASENVEFLVGYSKRMGQNIRLSDGVEIPFSAIRRESGIAKAIVYPNSENRLEFTFTDFDSLDQGGANPQSYPLATTNDFVGRQVDYSQIVGNWQFNPIGNDLVDLNATVYYNTTNQIREYDGVFVGANAGRANIHALDVFGIDIANRSVVEFGGLEHEIVFGIEYYTESQDGEETRALFNIPGAPGNSSGRPDADADHFGVFLTDEIDVTEDLTLFAGIRFDSYSNEQTAGGALSQSESALSPNVGFDLDLTEELSLVGRYSKAFTQPTLNDLYNNGSHFGIVPNTPFFGRIPSPPAPFGPPTFGFNYFQEVFIPNANLLPETSDNFELGLHFEDEEFLGGKVVSRLTGFYKDGQDTNSTTLTGTADVFPFNGFANPGGVPPGRLTNAFRQAVNLPETEIYGTEFTFDYDADVYFASLAAGLVRARNTQTLEKLFETPGDQISLTVGARPTPKIEVGAYGIWNGGRADRVSADAFTPASQPPKGWDIYGIFASYAVCEDWMLRFGVDNLFDLAYARTSTAQPEPGRNVFITSTLYW